MPNFNKLAAWEADKCGNVRIKLKASDGSECDATFDRSIIPGMLVLLNRLYMGGVEQFPDDSFREFAMSLMPLEFGPMELPGGYTALLVRTQSGMRLPIPMLPEACQKLSEALALLRPIVEAGAATAPPKH